MKISIKEFEDFATRQLRKKWEKCRMGNGQFCYPSFRNEECQVCALEDKQKGTDGNSKQR